MPASGTDLPPHVTLVGESLKPLLNKVQDALRDDGRPVDSTANLAAEAPQLVDDLGAALERIGKEMSGALSEVVAAEAVADAEVHRAIGRFESTVDELLGGYARLYGLRPDVGHQRGHELLLSVYRHPLTELRDWLQDAIATIADPVAARRKRGLPARGKATLDVTLAFTPAPERDRLLGWIERQERRSEGRTIPKWLLFVVGLLGGWFLAGSDGDE